MGGLFLVSVMNAEYQNGIFRIRNLENRRPDSGQFCALRSASAEPRQTAVINVFYYSIKSEKHSLFRALIPKTVVASDVLSSDLFGKLEKVGSINLGKSHPGNSLFAGLKLQRDL